MMNGNFLNRKVDFIIAGTQKGGTTALDSYLRTHPEIYMAQNKEVHFFDKDKLFLSEHVDYEYYHSFFSPKPCTKIVGEATPIYMYWYTAPRRIWEYNPEMKLIIILRNPILRAFSGWNMERERGTESLDFIDAIKNERERCRDSLPLQHRTFSYLDRGFYTEQLRRIWFFFRKDQTLILKNEDLRCNRSKTLSRICDFLEISGADWSVEKNVHSRKYIKPLSTPEIDYLKHIFEYEIKELERILSWDLSDWLSL